MATWHVRNEDGTWNKIGCSTVLVNFGHRTCNDKFIGSYNMFQNVIKTIEKCENGWGFRELESDVKSCSVTTRIVNEMSDVLPVILDVTDWQYYDLVYTFEISVREFENEPVHVTSLNIFRDRGMWRVVINNETNSAFVSYIESTNTIESEKIGSLFKSTDNVFKTDYTRSSNSSRLWINGTLVHSMKFLRLRGDSINGIACNFVVHRSVKPLKLSIVDDNMDISWKETTYTS